MTSINTNASAIAAVDILRAQGAKVLNAQQEVATGYRVKTASDNAAYWSIATQMKSDNKALSAAEDSLAFGAAAVDVAYTGFNQAIDVIRDIRNKLLTALGAGAEIDKINAEIQELRDQLRTVADETSFNGENWLVRRCERRQGPRARRLLPPRLRRLGGGQDPALLHDQCARHQSPDRREQSGRHSHQSRLCGGDRSRHGLGDAERAQ
ncbi:hypothetical protein H2O14_03840 [Rhizobium sp. G21]|nr:hypothetical protein [Rhizobium sp. G21]